MSINDTPQVSILLAIYKPRLDWFYEQLKSLNNQTYNNIKLYIYNDDPDRKIQNENILNIINKFDVEFHESIENKGSNKAFEFLTSIAEGDYFAYCDQDDIWLPNKISIMISKILKDKSVMACCDMYVIDENNKIVANSIRKIYKWHEFYYEDNITSRLLAKSFMTGCALIVDANIAKQSIPFLNSFYHDEWLGLYASLQGKISVIKQPLIKYRLHGNNQTSINKDGIYDKNSYINKLLNKQKAKINELISINIKDKNLTTAIEENQKWINAREKYYVKPNFKDLIIIMKYRKFGMRQVIIEIVIPLIPNKIFKVIVQMVKKGII